ncbi:MAG TPA: DUF2924 domain-containing protein [Hyphomonadaceae bacterium]|jgi:hypothetical protein|nr:DUF2924 domain-containing protein [Hyphomonadaceae bacterium]
MTPRAQSSTGDNDLRAEIERMRMLGVDQLRTLWRSTFGLAAPPALTKDLIARMLAWRMQEQSTGGLNQATVKLLNDIRQGEHSPEARKRRLRSGTVLVREYQGARHTVTIVPGGFVWREKTYASLSIIARAITGTAWNGPRFFGLRAVRDPAGGDGMEKTAITPDDASEGESSSRPTGPPPVRRTMATR